MRFVLMLIDGPGLWFRAYYAMRNSLVNESNQNVGAIRGFFSMLNVLIEDHKISKEELIVCSDYDWRPKFRVDALSSYKEHRVLSEEEQSQIEPDDLQFQVDIILEILTCLNISICGAHNFEADDAIATLAKQSKEDVIVVTGDKDLFQLVKNQPKKVKILYMGKGFSKREILGCNEIAEKFNFSYKNLDDIGMKYRDLAILRGDPSDGLPGIPGIGEKTAVSLINKFDNLNQILEVSKNNSENINSKIASKIINCSDYIEKARIVVTTVDTAEITPFEPKDCRKLDDLMDISVSKNAIQKTIELLKSL